MKGLIILLLFSCWIIAGITAGNTKMSHYREKSSSFCLQVRKSSPHEVVSWTFNEKYIVLNQIVRPTFTDKVVYNHSNKSLCINNLTEKDSGIYEVSLMDSEDKLLKEIHQLTVQETVPRPDIRMSVFSSNQSDGFCNITVTCSIQDNQVLSVCNEDSCTTSQRSFSGLNITIYAVNRAVVCSGSNYVSTSRVSESLEAKCFNRSDLKQEERPQQPTLTVIVIVIVAVAVAVCTSFCVFIVCAAKRNFSGHDHPQTQTSPAPAQIIQSQLEETESQPAPRLSSSSSEAEVSYENVETTQPRQISSPTVGTGEELGCRQNQAVDTVYSFLQAPKVTDSVGKSDSSKDTKEHMKLREASTSQTVILNETQQPAEIDTVYSVLQKPENMKSQHHQ